MSTEYLTIPNCPKCENKHKYKLNVDRAVVMKLMTRLGTSGANERPQRVAITRLFTCPAKKEDFQATFFLTDTSSDRIKTVEIAGIATSNNEND